MIGKIFGVLAFIVIVIALTGVNVAPVYDKLAHVRDSATPSFDHLVEKGLKMAADSKIKENVQPIIDNATSGSN